MSVTDLGSQSEQLHRRRRLLLMLLTFSLAILTVVFVAMAVLAQDDPSFRGAELDPEPGADFTLTNQHGEPESLADHRGKVVALTFLYTNCPDVCPLTASRLRQAEQQLGDKAEELSVVIVSVDPENDTPEAAARFLDAYDASERWTFLTGTRANLEPVWAAYWVGVTPESEVSSTSGGLVAAASGANLAYHEDHDHETERLLHTTPIHLIDRDGQMRAVHTTNGEPDDLIPDLVHDLELLLDE